MIYDPEKGGSMAAKTEKVFIWGILVPKGKHPNFPLGEPSAYRVDQRHPHYDLYYLPGGDRAGWHYIPQRNGEIWLVSSTPPGFPTSGSLGGREHRGKRSGAKIERNPGTNTVGQELDQ
ncbi:MAG: hypothetical protein L3J76_04205, partial [Candidatus Hydrothermae bacterium]|nr:hypothetical protein [Candidatus Hydrothermae bacterium]